MFKATPFEYRFRHFIHLAIFVLGLTAPWNYLLHLDSSGANAHLWGVLAAELARWSTGSIAVAFNVLLALAIVCAFAGAFLRTWGAAYLGTGVVQSHAMHTAQAAPTSGERVPLILQDGPFRYVRNPLYVGTFLYTLALSLIMSVSGAIFCLFTIATLQIRLIFAEETFLTERLGATYLAYCSLVPRIIPSLRSRIPATKRTPRWPQAVIGELYFWGVACSFAIAGWRYDETLLLKCVIVAFGVSLVMRALAPVPAPPLTEKMPKRG